MQKPIRPHYWPENGQPDRTEPFTWIVEDVIAASWWPDPDVFEIYEQIRCARRLTQKYGSS